MPFSESITKMFSDADSDSEEWDDAFLFYYNQEDPQNLKKYINYVKKVYLDEHAIFMAIFYFTLNIEEIRRRRRLYNLEKRAIAQDVKIRKSSVVITTNTGNKIKAYKLTDLFPELKRIDPNLETMKRLGKCHTKAQMISLFLNNIQNEIVTGYKCGRSTKTEYLHSWVELNMYGADLVIDGTLNAVMNKKGYYNLFHINPERITRIQGKTYREDLKVLKKIEEIGSSITCKEYLIFRDEIMKDLERNKSLLNEER